MGVVKGGESRVGVGKRGAREKSFDQGILVCYFMTHGVTQQSEIQCKMPLSTDHFFFSQRQGYVPTA